MYVHIEKKCLKMVVPLMMALALIACSKKAYIDVDYRLPADTDALAGRTVTIETRDLRSEKEIFDKRAKEQFKYFTGLFALSLILPEDQQKVLGAYELPKLFEAALAQRLQKLGVAVSDASSPNIAVFQIKIIQFRIKLIGQKWMADVRYEANLSQDAHLVAREVVTGSAERTKLVGSGGAEKVIGEIFTDMINRLDIERLFAQAKL